MKKLLNLAGIGAIALTVSVQSWAYDVLPSSFTLSKSGSGWTINPDMQFPVGSGRTGIDAIYPINQTSSLSDFNAQAQFVSFKVTTDSGLNLFRVTVGYDHVVVGLNHRTFLSGWTVATGNRFAGVAIGVTCQDSTAPEYGLVAIQIEWRADDASLPPAFSNGCFRPDAGITALRFDFTATYAGYVALHIYDASGVHLRSIYDHKPSHSNYGSTPAGAAVAVIGGTSSSPYGVTITEISHGFVPFW